MKKPATEPMATSKKMRPASTPEAREAQMVSLAYDLVEKRLREGTATSQETTHFLKLGSQRAQLEMQLLEKQAELAAAKAEGVKAIQRSDEMFKEAIEAMKRYSGRGGDDHGD